MTAGPAPGGIAAVILAGGAARRLGGQVKAELEIGGRRLIDRVRAAATGAAPILLNAPPELAWLAPDLACVPDRQPGRPGPTAGLDAAFAWLDDRALPHATLASLPCDTPFLPADLIDQLDAALTGGAEVAVVVSGGRRHPVCALWRRQAAPTIARFLAVRPGGSMTDLLLSFRVAEATVVGDPDPLFNVNTPDDLAHARRIAPR